MDIYRVLTCLLRIPRKVLPTFKNVYGVFVNFFIGRPARTIYMYSSQRVQYSNIGM